jgi:hypothetical protein
LVVQKLTLVKTFALAPVPAALLEKHFPQFAAGETILKKNRNE